MKVMIVVTHLLGTGHLARAAILGRAFAEQGHDVTLVSGGRPVPHIDTSHLRFVQLPPLASDGVDFTRLLDSHNNLAGPSVMTERRERLHDTLMHTHPDALITELFPFGRRNLSEEFLHLLTTANAMSPRPKVFSSIRDILAPPSKPSKVKITEDRIGAYYDAILVHSDPTMIPLELSWPVSPIISSRISYTGFVAPAPSTPHPDNLGRNEIIVSAGGGNVGGPVYQAALDAARLDQTQAWRILVGGGQAAEICANLSQNATANVTVEPARPEFRSMLHHAKASVSMCGYNTAMDVLQAGVPAIWVPFDAGGEVEQRMRAKALAHLPGMDVIETKKLSGETLNMAIKNVLAAPQRVLQQTAFDGADQAVRSVEELAHREK